MLEHDELAAALDERLEPACSSRLEISACASNCSTTARLAELVRDAYGEVLGW